MSSVSWGNTLYGLVALCAIIIPARNYKRITNLGGRRADFIKGSFLYYLILAAVVSFTNIIIYYTYDRFMVEYLRFGESLNLVDAFGWSANGPFAAFLQQFAFLFGLACFLHVFTTMQGTKLGLVFDIAILTIICVFTPIEPLRLVEIWFFNLTIFQPNAGLQILACLVFGCAFYLLGKPILARKRL
jgi:hypothetical protein